MEERANLLNSITVDRDDPQYVETILWCGRDFDAVEWFDLLMVHKVSVALCDRTQNEANINRSQTRPKERDDKFMETLFKGIEPEIRAAKRVKELQVR